MFAIPLIAFIAFVMYIEKNKTEKVLSDFEVTCLSYVLLILDTIFMFMSLVITLSPSQFMACFILQAITIIYISKQKLIKAKKVTISFNGTEYAIEKKCKVCNCKNHLPRNYCYACGTMLEDVLKNEEYSPYVVDSGEELLGIRKLTPEDLVLPINDKFMLGLQDKPKEKEISNNFTDDTHNHKESFDDLKNKILSEIYNKKYGTYLGYVVETSKKFIIIALCDDCIADEKWNITSFTKKHDYRPELNGTCYVEVESDKDMHDTFYIEVKIIQENKDTIIKMTNKHSGQHPHEYMIFDSTGEHTNYGLL